jgi:hypothetical protein
MTLAWPVTALLTTYTWANGRARESDTPDTPEATACRATSR